MRGEDGGDGAPTNSADTEQILTFVLNNWGLVSAGRQKRRALKGYGHASRTQVSNNALALRSPVSIKGISGRRRGSMFTVRRSAFYVTRSGGKGWWLASLDGCLASMLFGARLEDARKGARRRAAHSRKPMSSKPTTMPCQTIANHACLEMPRRAMPAGKPCLTAKLINTYLFAACQLPLLAFAR